jgi:hypothetical protein
MISGTGDYGILCVHTIGPQVSEFIGEVCLVMEFHADSEDVARTCYLSQLDRRRCARAPWDSTDRVRRTPFFISAAFLVGYSRGNRVQMWGNWNENSPPHLAPHQCH